MLQVHVAALTAALAAAAPTRAPEPDRFMHGVVVSCPGYGRVWGSAAMTEALRTLKSLGVDWVQIHPYAGVRRDGTIRWRPAASTGYLPRAAQIAKTEGVQLFWKPHLAYWGSFEWRGAITFDDPAHWRRFFDEYRAFIVDQARFAETHKIPLFSIGLEYHQTLRHESEWRRIIKEVRQVYRGRITYSANWDRLKEVPFWDAVDLIGVQAYFPLSERSNPSLAEIRKGWSRPLDELNALSKKHGKPYVFSEIGYSRSLDAARKPWAPDTDGSDEAIANRRRLMEVAFTRLADEKRLKGMFWWKWVPRAGYGDRDFDMRSSEATALMKRYWAGDSPAPR